jgi:oxygen-independent coproporphyrinogen-3 oxidase
MIRAFLARLRADFGLRSAEVTLECEPATKTRDAFAECRDAGVNRISVGVQAFQDEHLIRLNRAHRVRHSVAMVRDAQSAGFENVHIDLMYGLPGQAMSDWAETMARAVDLGVTHISTYRLIVFPNELLARSINHGELDKTPPPERINDMRLMADERFSAAGYQRYSLTELAKPGFECKYVRTSWDGSDYLGFGPGAYSRNGNTLWEDDVIHGAHERRIDEGRRPTGKSRVMTGEERLTRDIAMGLCLLRVDLGELEARSGFRTDPLFTETIRDCEEAGLLRRDGDVLTLTSDGIRYATEVMKSFTEGTRGKRRLPTPPVLA